jgi:dienelactone hydrolase
MIRVLKGRNPKPRPRVLRPACFGFKFREDKLLPHNHLFNRRAFLQQTATLAGASALSVSSYPRTPREAALTIELDRRREALEVLLKILPPTKTKFTGRINALDKTWEEWVRRTGELPPDFDSMPSIPGLPEPRLTTREEWPHERQRIRALFEQWVWGKMPPPPDNLRAVLTGTHDEGGVTVRDVRLEFGPDHRATLRIQLMVPPGHGPFPVFLTNHPRKRPWVATAVRRGYIGCIYFAADPIYGNSDDSDAFIDIYPEYDFSCLARWAWSAMRTVDYLFTLPEVDKTRIALSGHSRNGKQALLAAAFDERLAAVIPSSGNTGECNPWRYTNEMFVNESIEEITRGFPNWFHPRLRFFVGREDKLPVDQNLLMALVAPRGLFMYSAFAETEGGPFGFEQAYRSVLNVYRHFGAEDKLWLHLRDGEHPTTAEDIEVFVDFLDSVFGRKHFPKRETWMNGYTFEAWTRISGESIDPMRYPQRTSGDYNQGNWDQKKIAIQERLRWALGEEPAGIRYPAGSTLGNASYTSDGWMSLLFERPFKAPGMAFAPLPFGDDLKADLYYPENFPAGQRLPLVLWLHPFSYCTGYSRDVKPAFSSLIKHGFAVLAFDQIGFGTRVRNAREFYQRYPQWSLAGEMVVDTRAAIDAGAALNIVDPERIYAVGYALGGKIGLLTAALDDRVKALAVVAGFDPLRLDTAEKGVEGVRQYSHLHGLIPRFGFFAGHEDRLPIDFDEALALIAPRPALIVSPLLDRYAHVEDVRREIDGVRGVYDRLGGADALQFETPLDFNRFPPELQEQVINWLGRLAGTQHSL